MNGILKVSDWMLNMLLWPVVQLEQRFGVESSKLKFKQPRAGNVRAAHVERWGLMAVGVIAGLVPLGYLVGIVVVSGFLVSAAIDPIIWAWASSSLVERRDFRLGFVVNLAPIWMFWLGFLVGVVI